MTFFDVIIDNTYDNSYLLNKTSFTINDISNINRYDLRKWMSPLSNFEFLGSTANSLATLIEFDIPNFRCSRQFLYYNERIDTDSYNINVSIKRLLEYGFCSYDIYPYNSNNINKRPNDDIYKDGKWLCIESSKEKYIKYCKGMEIPEEAVISIWKEGDFHYR